MSTKEIKVTVASRTRERMLDPESVGEVFNDHDGVLRAETEELEEAITFLRLRISDIEVKRELLSRLRADVDLVLGQG